MTPLTLRRLESTDFAAIYFHSAWVGMVAIRVLPVDDQVRIMDGETVEVDLVLKGVE
jgi:hypothetical protein